MKRRKNFHPLKHKPLLWLQTVLNCGFVGLFAIFLVLGYGRASENPASSQLKTGDHASHLADGHHVSDTDSDHPLVPNRDPLEPEFPDEGESARDLDTELDELTYAPTAEATLNLHAESSLFLQLRLAHESRERISLVVLHHSWKSFLI
jgi:hypothetical protein